VFAWLLAKLGIRRGETPDDDHPLTGEERHEREYDPRLMSRGGDVRVDDLPRERDPKRDPS
jgi:hypothetical protein